MGHIKVVNQMKELRKTDAIGHPLPRPRLTNFAQDPISKCQGMEGSIITRSSLVVTKLPCNVTCRVVKATVKPNQKNTVILKVTVDHAWNVPPFHCPLNICDINALHELSELIKTHLSALRPTFMIVLREILTRRNSGGMKQLNPFI